MKHSYRVAAFFAPQDGSALVFKARHFKLKSLKSLSLSRVATMGLFLGASQTKRGWLGLAAESVFKVLHTD